MQFLKHEGYMFYFVIESSLISIYISLLRTRFLGCHATLLPSPPPPPCSIPGMR